jgi:hypothetical protein
MAVIATWSRIDCWLAEFLSEFLRTPDMRVAMAMYQALTSGGKRTALAAAANEALSSSTEDLGLFRAIISKLIKSSQDRRHDYAHHLWGISEDLPDALLLADPKAWVQHNTTRAAQNAAIRDPDLWMDILEQPSLPAPLNWKFIMVYERDVLKHDLDAANLAHALVFQLNVALSGKKNERTELVRKRLLSEPLVQQALQPPYPENRTSTPPPQRPKKPSRKQRRTAAMGKARASKAS